MFQFGVES